MSGGATERFTTANNYGDVAPPVDSECKCFLDYGGGNFDYSQNLWTHDGDCNHARPYNQQTKKRSCSIPCCLNYVYTYCIEYGMCSYDCSYTYWLNYYYIEHPKYNCKVRL